MWHFQKIDALHLVSGCRYVSVAGAGGKSTFLEYLADRQALAGKTVALTTTTKIYAKEPFILFAHMGPSPKGPVIRVGESHEGEKLTGLSFDEVKALGDKVDTVLVEADGAKHHPLKYPSPHEPLIPPFSDRVFVVAGLDGLHGRVDRKVFRWERFHDATGIKGDALVSREVFVSLFSPLAMLKNVDREKCTVVLNKYDALPDKREALGLAKEILDKGGCADVVISSVAFGLFYLVRRL